MGINDNDGWENQRQAMFDAWKRQQDDKGIYTLKREQLPKGAWRMWVELSDGKMIKSVTGKTLLHCLLAIKNVMPNVTFTNESQITILEATHVWLYITTLGEKSYACYFLNKDSAKACRRRDYDAKGDYIGKQPIHKVYTFKDSFTYLKAVAGEINV